MQAIQIDSLKKPLIQIPDSPMNTRAESAVSRPAIAAANAPTSSSFFSIACRSLLRCVGSICSSAKGSNSDQAREKLQTVGSPKTPTESNQKTEDTDLIVRTVMRCPNKKTLEALHELRENLRNRTEDLSDNYLNWLLDGSSRDARGGFKDAHSLRKFLSADPTTLSSSRLITGLSTLVHAIAYRAVQCGQALPPMDYPGKRNVHEKEMDKWMRRISENIVYGASARYPDCMTSVIEPAESPDCDHFEVDLREELSDVSDDEDAVHRVEKKPLKFQTKRDDGQYTWVGAAHAGGIPIKSTLSGSTLLALAVLDQCTPNSSPKIELLAGTLIIPTYHRADYHSIAETAATIHHYQDVKSASPNIFAVLTPKQAFAKGFELMTGCVDAKYQKSITVLSEDIIAKTTDVGYKAKHNTSPVQNDSDADEYDDLDADFFDSEG